MRVELKGQGIPIPLDALPIPSEDGDLPPQTLLLPPGDFDKQDYVGLGYTHYEAIAIGAVGGRGGRLLMGTPAGFDSSSRYYGGGGGGGGLHRVNGLLADLPDLTPVVVGEAGADGIDNPGDPKWLVISDYGDPVFPTERTIVFDTGARPFVRNGVTYINADGSYVAPYTKINVMGDPVASDYQQSGWDASGNIPNHENIVKPNPAWVPAQDGQDGGYSAFGDVCQASGGKGGKHAPQYSVGVNVGVMDERFEEYRRDPEDGAHFSNSYSGRGRPGGDGAEGGIGGSVVAGGGGVGGTSVLNFTDYGVSGAGTYLGSTPIAPEDGTWDGVIGKGGGGGRGGGYVPNQYTGGGSLLNPSVTALSQNGAQGSFNYGDTSFYGARQNRFADPTVNKLIAPGAGGGAKLSALQSYGGRSAGANPNGVVLIRIFRIV